MSDPSANESEHPNERTRETAALFALGALPQSEARAFGAHLDAGCPGCERDVEAFRAVVGGLAFAEAHGTPRPAAALRALLLARVAADRDQIAESPRDVPPRREAQVWRDWQRSAAAEMAPGLFTLRSFEGAWEPTAVPGVDVKALYVDSERSYVTMLVRMAPKSSYPRHRHAATEECYVLSGDLRVAGEVLHAGDYQRAEAESQHGEQSTEEGCLLLIVSSQDDELT